MKDSNSPDQAIDGENGAFEELDGTARNSERHVLMAGGAPAPVGDKRAARRAEVENFGPSTSEGSGAAPGEGVGIEAATGTHVIATPFPTERPERPVWLTDAHRCSTCKGRRFHLNPDTYFDRELWTWTRSCASCLAKRRSERRTGNRKAGRRTMTLEARRQATLRAQEASLRRTEAQIQAAASIHDGKSPAVGRGRPLRASARRARERGFGYKDAGGLDGEDPGASTSKPGERSGSPDAERSPRKTRRVWQGLVTLPQRETAAAAGDSAAEEVTDATTAPRSPAPGLAHPGFAAGYQQIAHWAAGSYPGGIDPRLAAAYQPAGEHAHQFLPAMHWPFPGGATAARQAPPQQSPLHPYLAAFGMPASTSAASATPFATAAPTYQHLAYPRFFPSSFAQAASGAPPGSGGGHFLPGRAPGGGHFLPGSAVGGGGGNTQVEATPRLHWTTADQRARLGSSWPSAYAAVDVGGQRQARSAFSHSPSPEALYLGARPGHVPSSGGSSA